MHGDWQNGLAPFFGLTNSESAPFAALADEIEPSPYPRGISMAETLHRAY